MEVEINYTRVADTNPTITLRNNWSCRSKRIWSEFREGDATSSRVIITEGHDFESSTKPSKSHMNMRDMNWSYHVE